MLVKWSFAKLDRRLPAWLAGWLLAVLYVCLAS